MKKPRYMPTGLFTKRPIDNQCERWFSDDKHLKNGKVTRCPEPSFYQCDNTGLFFCKKCAREITKRNVNVDFTRIP